MSLLSYEWRQYLSETLLGNSMKQKTKGQTLSIYGTQRKTKPIFNNRICNNYAYVNAFTLLPNTSNKRTY